MVTVGLVAEGTHDFIMLRPLIEAELRKKTGESITFHELQPLQDATGRMTDGGWHRVVAWCQTYRGGALETFFTPLFAGQPACDAIIIHVDGDALNDVAPHASIAAPPAPVSVAQRVSFLTHALETLLAVPRARRETLALAIPVQCTEAWILTIAGYLGDPTTIDAKREFRLRSIRPMRRHYEVKVAHATAGAWVAPTCLSYTSFAGEIAKLPGI